MEKFYNAWASSSKLFDGLSRLHVPILTMHVCDNYIFIPSPSGLFYLSTIFLYPLLSKSNENGDTQNPVQLMKNVVLFLWLSCLRCLLHVLLK